MKYHYNVFQRHQGDTWGSNWLKTGIACFGEAELFRDSYNRLVLRLEYKNIPSHFFVEEELFQTVKLFEDMSIIFSPDRRHVSIKKLPFSLEQAVHQAFWAEEHRNAQKLRELEARGYNYEYLLR